MKNLIFCKHRLTQRVTLLAYDSDFHKTVGKAEPVNFFVRGAYIEDMFCRCVGGVKDTTLLYNNKSYYMLDGYDGLNMDELRAVVDVQNETLTRRIFIDNGFTVDELDEAFEKEDIYELLK